MTYYFSKSSGGFYNTAVQSVMPSDVVTVSDEQYKALLQAQEQGKLIQADADGNPQAVVYPPLTGNALIQSQIDVLEKTVTQRRIREAIAAIDNGWLLNITSQISALRSQFVSG
jgi:hypothetical protein